MLIGKQIVRLGFLTLKFTSLLWLITVFWVREWDLRIMVLGFRLGLDNSIDSCLDLGKDDEEVCRKFLQS